MRDGSESAFAQLVRRHVDLVHSAALRQGAGNFAGAQDVTQQVFGELARRAPRLLGHPSLAGWLYNTARFIAARVQRAEQRRAVREQNSLAMPEPGESVSPDWQALQPVIDEAMFRLSAADREAVVLRFFQNQPHFTVAALGRRFQRLAEEPRRNEIRHSKYWQMPSIEAGREWAQSLPRLRAELDAELARLLGVPANEVRAGFDLGELTGVVAELPPERRDEWQALHRQHASEAGELDGQLPTGPFGSLQDDPARQEMRALRERQRAELAQFLGPELFERYDVRESAEAQYVRMNLPEAKSEDEFRRLVQAAREVGVEPTDIMAD